VHRSETLGGSRAKKLSKNVSSHTVLRRIRKTNREKTLKKRTRKNLAKQILGKSIFSIFKVSKRKSHRTIKTLVKKSNGTEGWENRGLVTVVGPRQNISTNRKRGKIMGMLERAGGENQSTEYLDAKRASLTGGNHVEKKNGTGKIGGITTGEGKKGDHSKVWRNTKRGVIESCKMNCPGGARVGEPKRKIV